MRRIAICCLPRSTVFSHITSQTARFTGEKVIEPKMCVLILSVTFVWNIFCSKKNWARYDPKCNLFEWWDSADKQACSAANL